MNVYQTQSESGFTLIELLVVIAIIGVLSAIAFPQYANYRTGAFNSAAQSDLRNARLAQEATFVVRNQFSDCMNRGCNAALPGFHVSEGVSIACTPRGNGNTLYQCSTRHNQGTTTYYYDSELSASWEI